MPGQPVEIEVDMFPGATFKGRVDSIAPASGQEFALLPPDNATGNFTKVVQRIPVKIVLDAGSPLCRRAASGHVGHSDHRHQGRKLAGRDCGGAAQLTLARRGARPCRAQRKPPT